LLENPRAGETASSMGIRVRHVKQVKDGNVMGRGTGPPFLMQLEHKGSGPRPIDRYGLEQGWVSVGHQSRALSTPSVSHGGPKSLLDTSESLNDWPRVLHCVRAVRFLAESLMRMNTIRLSPRRAQCLVIYSGNT
jgi:hypothetical protein